MKFWKRALIRAVSPPPPENKRAFLRKLPPQEAGLHLLLLTQIGFLRKWVWGVSALLFAAALAVSRRCSPESVWVFSALTPLLALMLTAESGRSEACGMAELEMAARFSLRSVILMRLTILGISNLLVLGGMTVLAARSRGFFAAGVYLLTPFLLTAMVGSWLLRQHRGREGLYLCAGVCVLVSFAALLSGMNYPRIYQENSLCWWTAAALCFCIGAGKQYTQFVNGMEEVSWSLS
ncbi:MAG: hypothetical protein ACI3WQ_08885 [Faecousia sp.]